MNNYDFTKSFIRDDMSKPNEMLNKTNELNRLKRISDNMNGINPFTKEKMNNEQELKQNIIKQDNDIMNRMDAIKNIKKD